MSNSLEITCKRLGKQGKALVAVWLPDGTSYTDTVNLADAKARKGFLSALCKGRKGLDRKAVGEALERFAVEFVEAAGERRPSQADVLVELVVKAGVELFHTPGGHDSEAYATLPYGSHKETWPINSNAFGRYLSRLYYEQLQKVPGAQAVQDAKNVLAGKALHDGVQYPVAIRLCEHEGAIYLDLTDDDWKVVRITATDWSIVTDVPVKFVRKRGMLPLPAPVPGGRLNELFALVNLPTEDHRILFTSFLVKAYRPGTPFPVLSVNGEQGCAKTTLCQMARELIDPNEANLRRPPRNEHDLVIAASNGWVVGFDNLSGISAELSDALCCLSTGGGFGTRELYSDADEKLFRAMRPVILNGIDDVIWRPDLLDRAITLNLPVIDSEHRLDEDTLWRRFREAQPRILGALFDVVSVALERLPTVQMKKLPRMADFAKWITAAEPALGLSPGQFMEIYLANKGEADAQILEGSPLAQAVLQLMEYHPRWEGTATTLLSNLNTYCPDDVVRRDKKWPKNGASLSGMLRRLAPGLRRGAGISVILGERDDTKHRNRLIRLERVS